MRTTRLLVAAAALAAVALPAIASASDSGPGPGGGCTIVWSPATTENSPVQVYLPSGMVC